MKNLAGRWSLLFMIFWIFVSCRKQDSVTPGSSFRSLRDGAIVWNNADVSIDGIDDNQQLTVTANGAQVYRGSNGSATWDTQTVEDGNYELIAAINNEIKSKALVAVRNTLIYADIPANHLRSLSGFTERGWIFLSSATGEVVAVTEMQNGKRAILSNSGFDSKTFNLSEVYLTGNGLSLDITTLIEVPRGQWTPAQVTDAPSSIGDVSIKFSDSVGVHPYYISTNGDSHIFYDGGNSVNLQIAQSPSKVFVRSVGADRNFYNLIPGLTSNSNYVSAFQELKKPLLTNPATVSSATRAGVRLYGFPKQQSYDESYLLGAFPLYAGQVVVEYPGSEFPQYGSETLYTDKQINLHCFNPTKMYDFTPLSAQVIFKDKGSNSMTLATSGNFDIYFVGWGYGERGISLSWSLIGGVGRSEYLRLPRLPIELQSIGNSAFNPLKLNFAGVVQIADYEIAADYQSFLTYVSQNGLNAPYDFGKGWKEQAFNSDGITLGGRMSTDSLPTIKERLSRRR